MLQAPFMMLGMLIMMGQRAAASADRIYEILDEQPTVVDKPDAVDLTECRGDVRFTDVRFAYGGEDENPVLADFNLHLSPGETVALVGRTGAGKSTVSRLLTRFYDVNSGSVRIDDHDIRDLTMDSLRANIGIVLDEPFLFSVSVRDNIAYGKPDASFDEIEAAAQAAGAHEFITDLENGYDTVVGERGYTLSGGQRQRIAIARTLLVNPPILVLDDATSAIDVQVELEIHAGLRVLMEGRTTLIIAHRLSTISLADRVVLLDQHRIVADGTHAELLETTPLYGEVLAQAVDRPRARRGGRLASTNGTSNGAQRQRTRDRRRMDLAPNPDPVGSGRSTGGTCDLGYGRWRPRRRVRPFRRRRGCPLPVSPPSCRAAWTGCCSRSPSTPSPTSSSPRTARRWKGARLTLWRLLMEYPGMLALAGLLVVVIAVDIASWAQAHRDRHQCQRGQPQELRPGGHHGRRRTWCPSWLPHCPNGPRFG